MSDRAGSSDEECPRGVMKRRRGDTKRYSARVVCLRDGVKALGDFLTPRLASQAWDEEMCRRFLLASVLPVLNDAAAASGEERVAGRAAAGGVAGELLEALLGDDAWHDVVMCGIGHGGVFPPLQTACPSVRTCRLPPACRLRPCIWHRLTCILIQVLFQ